MAIQQLLSSLNQGGGSSSIVQQPAGALSVTDPTSVTTSQTSVDGSATTGSTAPNDSRIRLRPITGQEDQVYGTTDPNDDSMLLSILNSTGGLLFPYTPTIAVTQDVDYKDIVMNHTIGDIAAYNRTPSVSLSVTADFTVQNQREGKYALAALHFLRTVSKMYFGDTDNKAGKAGLPPPILIFAGYGNFVFNNLPVIVKSHSYTFDKAMNMIPISTGGGVAVLPAMFQISMTLQVQQTPAAMRTVFSLDSFRSGDLLDGSATTGWI